MCGTAKDLLRQTAAVLAFLGAVVSTSAVAHAQFASEYAGLQAFAVELTVSNPDSVFIPLAHTLRRSVEDALRAGEFQVLNAAAGAGLRNASNVATVEIQFDLERARVRARVGTSGLVSANGEDVYYGYLNLRVSRNADVRTSGPVSPAPVTWGLLFDMPTAWLSTASDLEQEVQWLLDLRIRALLGVLVRERERGAR